MATNRDAELQPFGERPPAEAGNMGLQRQPRLAERRGAVAPDMDKYAHGAEQRIAPRQRKRRRPPSRAGFFA